ncbi:diaminopimelate decarboxylase, partial [Pelagibacteraceae bacterium]|nr:diaminopimelate decarboxylase [Pelagibacteraceae bacterium]
QKLVNDLEIKLKYIDLGGGFGINYNKKVKKINLQGYAKLVLNFKKKLKCDIIFEPGRFLVGNTGVLVSKIQYIKKGQNKDFIILDAGMNDFMRPALYDAVHNIIPLKKNSKRLNNIVEFVGPICESTCKFTKYKKYQKIYENDFVAITNTGAYGSSLSSNYNTKPLIAEILVDKKKIKVIRKKQDLLKLINS